MAVVTLKGQEVALFGELPLVGECVPDILLARSDLSDVTLETFAGKAKLFNIFPSLDTQVCAKSVKVLNERAADFEKVIFLNISMDLPFAQSRFCGGEGIKDSEMLSAFRSSFAQDYGLEISEGPFKGLCARVVLLLDDENRVVYRELVPEIAHEPNYEQLLSALEEVCKSKL